MAYTTINKPTDYFNTKLYTGNGSTQSITGVGFQPDLIWQKERSSTSYHVLTDTVRGNTKQLFPNVTAADVTDSNYITSFDSDGFGQGQNNDTNENSQTYVSWNWKANGAGSTNTDGSITSTVSANTTSGFSIVTYSGNGIGGATVGHGLGSALGLIILKCKSTAATSWQMFHKSLGATKSINLDDTAAAFASTAYWNDTAPTSSVFSLGTGGDLNNVNRTYVAYCFAEKQGYSKFGSYVGNNSNDGSFIYTGFKPAWVLIKRYDAAASWFIFDNKRDTDNPLSQTLLPNLSNAEGTETSPPIDFLSNGFKMRYAHPNFNTGSYIYMAFAENPLVGTNNIPATAR